MRKVFITYYKGDAVNSTTAAMTNEEGLFKFPLDVVTLIYDDREPPTDFKWGYETLTPSRRFYRSFDKMAESVNIRFRQAGIPYRVVSFIMQKY